MKKKRSKNDGLRTLDEVAAAMEQITGKRQTKQAVGYTLKVAERKIRNALLGMEESNGHQAK